MSVNVQRVGPGYFELFGFPIVSGRVFSDVQEEEEFNIVINESLVAALRLEHPVGQKVNIWEDAPSFTVIGVVKDVIQSAHNKPGNWIYTAYRDKFSVLAVKFAAGKYTEVNDAVRKVLRKYAKEDIIFIGFYNPLEEETLTTERLYTYLITKTKALCKTYDIEYLDIYNLFKKNKNYIDNPTNIYPSTEAYQMIAIKIIENYLNK